MNALIPGRKSSWNEVRESNNEHWEAFSEWEVVDCRWPKRDKLRVIYTYFKVTDCPLSLTLSNHISESGRTMVAVLTVMSQGFGKIPGPISLLHDIWHWLVYFYGKTWGCFILNVLQLNLWGRNLEVLAAPAVSVAGRRLAMLLWIVMLQEFRDEVNQVVFRDPPPKRGQIFGFFVRKGHDLPPISKICSDQGPPPGSIWRGVFQDDLSPILLVCHNPP